MASLRALDRSGNAPSEQHAGENQETDREQECQADGQAGENGHGTNIMRPHENPVRS